MSDARNHHFIPKAYLRGFAQDRPGKKEPQVWVTDLVRSRSFSTSIRNIAARRDFNRIEVEEHPPNALEEAYGGFESLIRPSIKRIVKSGAFLDKDRLVVLNLIAILSVRSPGKRRIISEFIGDISKKMLQITLGTQGRYESIMKDINQADGLTSPSNSVSYDEMKKFVESDEYDVNVDQTYLIGLELSSIDVVLRTLLSRKWRLLLAERKSGEFITSDDPACLKNTKELPSDFMGPGHGMSDTVLLFPLSRKAALIGSFEGEEGTIDCSPNLIGAFNSDVISNAREQIYSYDNKFRYYKHPNLYPGSNIIE